MGKADGAMNPVAMAIINPGQKIFASWASDQRPPVLKSCMLPAELKGLCPKLRVMLLIDPYIQNFKSSFLPQVFKDRLLQSAKSC